MVRAGRISKNYTNDTTIRALCRKAGIPAADVRGPITSRRARSTIATQLYNAKEPMMACLQLSGLRTKQGPFRKG